jgi:hypothetical protein
VGKTIKLKWGLWSLFFLQPLGGKY